MSRRRDPVLGPGAIKAIKQEVELVFDRAKARVLGPQSVSKRIVVSYNRHFSLPGLFEQASREEGVSPNLETLAQLLNVAEGYVDSIKERITSRTVAAIQAFVRDSHRKGAGPPDIQKVLGGELTKVWGDAVSGMRKIIDAEANHTKNLGVLDGIIRVNAISGVDDPCVFFVVVRDKDLCEECKRIHLLPDEVTPRVWRLSSVGHGYHKKGEDHPKMMGLHPHCRCTMATLLPGYGFNAGGQVTFISPKHDEYEKQRG